MGPKFLAGQVCLGCYNAVDGRTRCSRCGWPMCGRDECGDGDHAAECQLITSGGGRPIVGAIPIQAYQTVMVLRCLALRDNNKGQQWRELIQLESHAKARRQNGMEDADQATVVRFIRDTLGLQVPEDVILQVCGILLVNSFEQPVMNAKNQHGLQAVYSTASLLEHDCVANATKSFNNKGQIVVRAAVPISKGEKIALCYTEPLWGTINRQRHLSQTKFFQCRCERCKDPSELDTYISSLYCQQCPNVKPGILLSENPFDEASDWICRQCGSRQPAKYVADIIETVGKEIVALKKGSASHCEQFLAKYSKILHPNHFYLTDVKMALCQMYGHLEGQSLIEMSDDVLNTKETLALELIKLADAVSPGTYPMRRFTFDSIIYYHA